MRRLGTWLGTLVLIVAAAYGGYWYQVKSKVDEVVEQLSPFASVQYGAIHAHPNGTVGVNGLTVLPHQMHAPLSISQIRVHVGSPLYVLFGGDEPPEELFISLSGVEQSLESALFREMQKQMDLMLEADPLYVSPAALGCGNVRQFDVNSLRAMGYRDLKMDIDVHYRGDEVAREIRFDAGVNVAGMGDTSMTMAFSADPAQLKSPMMATSSARLKQFQVDYSDRGYNKRLISMCAREAELRPADYLSHHQALFQRWIVANGIEVPENWVQSYEQMQQEGMTLSLSLEPIGGFGSAELMMMQDPGYLIEKLNPSLKVNGAPVELGGIKWDQLMMQVAQSGSGSRVAREGEVPVVGEAARAPDSMANEADTADDSSTTPAVHEPAVTEQLSSRRVVESSKQFRATPVAELDKYLGKPVRIFTYFGNDVEGRLVSADDQGVRVLQRMAQGVAEYPLDRARIQQVEVYR